MTTERSFEMENEKVTSDEEVTQAVSTALEQILHRVEESSQDPLANSRILNQCKGETVIPVNGHAAPSSASTLTKIDIWRHFHPSLPLSQFQISTLNASEANPSQLAYILVFPASHPDWSSSSILHPKTDLELLPEYHHRVSPVLANPEHWTTKAGDVELTAGIKSEPQCLPRHDGPDGECLNEDSSTSRMISCEDQGYGSNDAKPSRPRVFLDDGPNGEIFDEDGNICGIIPREGVSEEMTASTSFLTTLEDVLPAEWVPDAHQPVAVFTTEGRSDKAFRFSGWFYIRKATVIAKRSNALAQLREKKWNGTDVQRSAESWNKDFDRHWASIELQQITPGSEDCPAIPDVKTTDSHLQRPAGHWGHRQTGNRGRGGRGGSWGKRGNWGNRGDWRRS